MKYLVIVILLGFFATSANAGRCLIKIIKENSTTQVCHDVTKDECIQIFNSVNGNGDAYMSFDGGKQCKASDDWTKLIVEGGDVMTNSKSVDENSKR